MGLAKVIGIILLVIIIFLGVIGVDLYLTFNTFSQVDPSTLVSNPQYENVDNSTIEISVEVSLPSGGFIPKGVVLSVTIDAGGVTDTETEQINLGETKTLIFSFQLTETHKQTLITGGSIDVSGTALVTPVVFGFEIQQLEQQVDLGSTTISG